MAQEFNDGNFEEILKSNKYVVADFWAEWCGPCRMIAPIIEELSKEYEGKIAIGKVDVDNNIAIASKYGIRSIPTIIFFKYGQEADKHIGALNKDALVKKLENLLS